MILKDQVILIKNALRKVSIDFKIYIKFLGFKQY